MKTGKSAQTTSDGFTLKSANSAADWGPVWEVTEEHPIGDGVQIPEGATNIPRNFLRQLNIGREMAKAVLSITESDQSNLLALPDVPMEFKESREYSRLSNWLFRAGLSPRSVLPRNINLELTQVECLLENDCLADIDLESPVENRTGLGACLVNNDCVQMDANGNLDIGTTRSYALKFVRSPPPPPSPFLYVH